jgi:hypothetical protein
MRVGDDVGDGICACGVWKTCYMHVRHWRGDLRRRIWGMVFSMHFYMCFYMCMLFVCVNMCEYAGICGNMREYVRICGLVTVLVMEYVHVVCGRPVACMYGVGAAICAAEYGVWCSPCISICACAVDCVASKNGNGNRTRPW